LETTHKCGPSGPVSVSVPSSCVKEVKAVVDRPSLRSLSNDQMVNTATPGLTFVPLQVRAGGRAGSRVVRAREMTQRAGEERRK
jgi:hypothetical protein